VPIPLSRALSITPSLQSPERYAGYPIWFGKPTGAASIPNREDGTVAEPNAAGESYLSANFAGRQVERQTRLRHARCPVCSSHESCDAIDSVPLRDKDLHALQTGCSVDESSGPGARKR
jgi:hypothetical protein